MKGSLRMTVLKGVFHRIIKVLNQQSRIFAVTQEDVDVFKGVRGLRVH